jgi:hypothetical protein
MLGISSDLRLGDVAVKDGYHFTGVVLVGTASLSCVDLWHLPVALRLHSNIMNMS